MAACYNMKDEYTLHATIVIDIFNSSNIEESFHLCWSCLRYVAISHFFKNKALNINVGRRIKERGRWTDTVSLRLCWWSANIWYWGAHQLQLVSICNRSWNDRWCFDNWLAYCWAVFLRLLGKHHQAVEAFRETLRLRRWLCTVNLITIKGNHLHQAAPSLRTSAWTIDRPFSSPLASIFKG